MIGMKQAAKAENSFVKQVRKDSLQQDRVVSDPFFGGSSA